MKRPRIWIWLRIALFAAVVTAPALRMALPAPPEEALGEERELAGRPAPPATFAELETFPRRFDAWFDDQFGFRGPLVRSYHRAMRRILQQRHGRVVVGRDGWLFHSLATPAHEDAGPFSEGELLHWQEALEIRSAWLAARGLPLLVVVTPSKSTIYPEHLPDGLDAPAVSRLDQLLTRLRERGTVDILDLRPALRAARERERVYQKTDFHFDDAGSHAAYEAVLAETGRRLGVVLVPDPRDGFEETVVSEKGGNMAQLMGLADQYTEVRVRLTPKVPGDYKPVRADPSRSSPWVNRTLVSEGGPPDAPRLVVFGDSFGNQLARFLSPHFSRVTFFNPESIDARSLAGEAPQLVVNQLAEFKLQRPPEMDSTEVMDWSSRHAFDAATPLLTLAAAAIRERFEPEKDADWAAEGLPGQVRTRSRYARVLAPAFEPPAEGATLVRIVLDAATEDTRARLSYGIEGVEGFRDARSRTRRIHPGENVLTFAVVDERFDGRLALLPGGHPGLYELRRFEVRAAPRSR